MERSTLSIGKQTQNSIKDTPTQHYGVYGFSLKLKIGSKGPDKYGFPCNGSLAAYIHDNFPYLGRCGIPDVQEFTTQWKHAVFIAAHHAESRNHQRLGRVSFREDQRAVRRVTGAGVVGVLQLGHALQLGRLHATRLVQPGLKTLQKRVKQGEYCSQNFIHIDCTNLKTNDSINQSIDERYENELKN